MDVKNVLVVIQDYLIVYEFVYQVVKCKMLLHP